MVSSTATSMTFCAEVRIALLYSASESAWSVSTPIAHFPAASIFLMEPLPVPPATGPTMSAPWSMNVVASCSPFAGSPQGLVPPTKVPVCFAASQPRSFAVAPFFSL